MSTSGKNWSDSELPGHLHVPSPTGWGKKTLFWDRLLNFDETYRCKGTGYQQPGRNLSNYRDSLQSSQIWWTLV